MYRYVGKRAGVQEVRLWAGGGGGRGVGGKVEEGRKLGRAGVEG